MLYIIIDKKEGNPPFATTWMNLEDIMLSEISQTEKDKYCIISPICGMKKKKSNSAKKRVEQQNSGFQGLGWGWEEEVDRCWSKHRNFQL